LSLLTDNEAYRRHATTVLRLMADQIRRYPSAFGCALTAVDFYLNSPVEIAIVGRGDDPRSHELVRAAWQTYLPNRVIALSIEDDKNASHVVALLRDRTMQGALPTAFVCEAYTCQNPVSTPADLLNHLAKTHQKSVPAG
jgi:uncharacterized protein YyaL (SSP411 family)